MICVGVIFSNGALPSIYGGQPHGWFGDSHGTPLDNSSIRCNTIPVLEVLLGYDSHLGFCLHYLVILFRSLWCMYIFLGSSYCIRFILPLKWLLILTPSPFDPSVPATPSPPSIHNYSNFPFPVVSICSPTPSQLLWVYNCSYVIFDSTANTNNMACLSHDHIPPHNPEEKHC